MGWPEAWPYHRQALAGLGAHANRPPPAPPLRHPGSPLPRGPGALTSPGDPQAPLWRRILRIWTRPDSRDLGLVAAGVAFFGFLALFPAITAIITIWGYAADPVVIREQLAPVERFLPPDAFLLISSQVEGLLATANRNLGWASLLSTGLAIWSARAGVAALIQGLNAIHGLPPRSGLRHVLQAFLLTLVLVVLALLAMTLMVVAPLAIRFLPLGELQAWLLSSANLVLGLALLVMSIAIIYRIGPHHQARPSRFMTPGLVTAVVLWVAASRGFVFYLANFANYNQIYGSIGAVAAFLVWFYLSAYAVLLGAAVDAELGPGT